MDVLTSFKAQSNVTRTQWAAYLEGLYYQTYQQLFGEADASQRHFSPEKKVQVSGEIFATFAERFFDANGFFEVADIEAAAPVLATLYTDLITLNAYGEDTSLTTRLFFTMMGEMRGFREKLGGIDFRRLSSDEVEILRHPQQNMQQLKAVFISAMQRGRDPQYPSHLPPHPHWPDYSISINGLRFLKLPADSARINLYASHPEGEDVVVLSNGKLVAYSRFLALLQQENLSHHLLGEWRIPKQEWVGELKNLPEYFSHAAEIDYQEVTASAAPLCLSLHPFTHLSHVEHQQLDTQIRQYYPQGIMALAEASIEAEMLQKIPSVAAKIRLAAARIRRITASLRAHVEEEISAHPEAKAVGASPLFLMTMGGSGSGKNSNRFYREKTAELAFIYTSLDDGRAGNDIYHILVAAGHHADDYEAVHLWADMRRNWLCDAALKAGMNVIYDGSGIEYAGRYDAIIRRFADAGYQTEIIAADCMLVIAEERKSQFSSSALERVMKRAKNAKNHYRTLPWRVVMNKHIGFPKSFLSAFYHTAVRHLSLVDNAGGQERDYILAQMLSLPAAKIPALQQARAQHSLHSFITAEKLWPQGANPASISEEKLDFLLCPAGEMVRVLLIIDVERMVDILEKGQLNPNAHSPQALTWLKRSASFLIDRMDKPSGYAMIPAKIKLTTAKPKDAPRSNYLRLNSGV